VASIETCGCVADFDRVTGKLTVYMTHPGAARHPHRLRAGGRARLGLSEEKIRMVSPDIGAGSAARCPCIPDT